MALVALAACVPAAEDPNPRGGVKATVVPSAATRGEPFTSEDGWSVTIDRFAARVAVSVQLPLLGGNDSSFAGGSGTARVIGAHTECELFVSAQQPGTGRAGLQLPERRYFGEGVIEDVSTNACGVDADLLLRFSQRAEGDIYSFPSMVLGGHAEKGERSVRFDFALYMSASAFFTRSRGWEPLGGVPIQIVANEGAPIRLGLDAAKLFVPDSERMIDSDPRPILFDVLAAADANGDGTVTASELDRAKVPCLAPPGPETASCTVSLIEVLTTMNGREMFVPAP